MPFVRMCGFALASLVVAATPSGAQQTTLIFATANPANSHLTVQVMRPWAERINEQGKGMVKIEVRDGLALANLTNAYDRVINDVVQIAWTLPGYVAGKFPRTQVTSLPFVSGNGEYGSVAMARLYQEGVLAAEYDEIVPLMLSQISHTGVQTAKPLKSLDDLSGVKLITTSRTQADTMARLGATPLSIPLTDMYEAIQRGTADGAAVGWTAFQPFKLAEVTHYHVDAELGASMGMVFMARKKYAALPEEVRRIIDANSGEAASRRFGQFWDRVGAATRDQVKAMSGHTVVAPSAAQTEAWRQKTAPVIDGWIKATPDGEKILSVFRATLAKVKGGG
jgi:TRAP-type C4-dicarboxylate transport system substrate-binding protein